MTKIGKYELFHQFATERLAEVFLARTRDATGEEWAVKVKRLRPDLQGDAKLRQAFLDGARLASRLRHRNIARVIECGEADGSCFLVTEHVDGPSLRGLSLAMHKPLRFSACAKIASSICEGLAYAHEYADPETGRPLDIVHGDLSLENVALTRTGTVKVMGFGMARAVEQLSDTQPPPLRKLAYMSPEHLRGEALDRRADVFALGVLLSELLWNQRRSAIPVALAAILEKAMRQDREERYPDCRAMQADLERFLDSTGERVEALHLSRLVRIWGDLTQLRSAPARPKAVPLDLDSTRERGSRTMAARELPPEPKPVHLGASAPSVVSPGQEFTARFSAYHPSLAREVEDLLRKVEAKAKPRLGLARVLWRRGTAVTVRVSGEHLEASPASQEFTWEGEQHHLDFDVTVRKDAPECITRLKFDVCIGGLVLSRLRLNLTVRSASARPSRPEQASAFATSPRTAFASYASSDLPRVLDRVAALRIGAGLDVFVDCLSLNPNEGWRSRLEQEIPARDVFMLFWSEAAASSRWVEWEWRLALQRKGLDAIQAHPLDPQPRALPPELSSLHFGDPLMAVREAALRSSSPAA